MANSNAIRAGRAYVEIGADSKELVKGLNKLSQLFRGIGAMFSQLGSAFIKAGLAMASPLALATRLFVSMGSAIAEASAKTGIGAEALSELRYAAEKTGVDFEELTKGVGKMQKFLFSAAEGSRESEKTLSELGLTLANLKGLSPDQQFEKIGDALSKIQDPTERTALAMKVFGKSGADLLPLFKNGASGIEAFRQRARDLGITLSQADVEGAKSLGNSFGDLLDVGKSLGFVVGAAIAPALKSFVKMAIDGIAAVRQFVNEHRSLITGIALAAAGLLSAGIALKIVGSGFSFVSSIAGVAASAILGIGSAISLAVSPIGLLTGALIAAGYAIYRFTDIGGQIAAVVGPAFNDLRDVAVEAFGGIVDALAAGDWKVAAQIAVAYVQYAFDSGLGLLKKTWEEFKLSTIKTFFNTVAGIESLWVIAVSGISKAWLNTVTFAEHIWDAFADSVLDAWDATGNALMKKWNQLKEVYDTLFGSGTFNAADENQKIDAQQARKGSQRETDRANGYAGEEADLQRKLAEWKKQADAELAKIAGDAQSGKAGASKASTSEIDRLRKELDDLKNQQHDIIRRGARTAAVDALGPQEWLSQYQSAAAANAAGANSATGLTGKGSGTFNAAMAFGFGRGGIEGKIDKTNHLLEQIRDKGPGVAGDVNLIR